MLVCPNRYKTRPVPQKSPFLSHFRHAGRKLSRFSQSQPQQGEFSLVVSVSDQSKATCGAPPAEGFLSRRSSASWRLGCCERNIAPAWDCACRHEILIAPARLKPLIFPLFCRAGVVFLSRRPSNTQHSDLLGWFFFHGSYRTLSTAACWGDVSFTVRPQPRHTSRKTKSAEATKHGMHSKHTKRGQ